MVEKFSHKKNDVRRVSAYLTHEQYDMLQQIALEQNIPLTRAIGMLIELYYKKEKE